MIKVNLFVKIFGAILVTGLVILMYSVNLGDYEVANIIQSNGGSIDTNAYLIFLEQSITKYRFLGSILSVLGGLGILKSIDTNS
ncbi:hypothetical protein D2A34_14095 [Clostridium chromiireducens]|uniref:Uncharacterized protein n=1 Tax=Clostridium chromiireducens TaxID=225345 RepID=A0A399IME8_9CLOT|nr:hypothetical protein [Clostridium chromiireducens]RII34278.1 hypothetical protein D2A34_14095 [Clostridium chromiireducens]